MTWGEGSTRQSRKTRAFVLARADYRCEIQGPECIGEATEDDHIIPRSQGGDEHDPSNRQAACKPCHAEKTKAERLAGKAKRWRPKPTHPGSP